MLPFFKANKFLLLILLLQLFLGYKVIDKGHNWGGDFALYIDESRSIIEGRFWDFYHQNLFTVNNSHKTLAPIAEPLGAPILFVPVITFFGINLLMLKYLMLVFYLANAFLLWKLLNEINMESSIMKFSILLFVVSYFEFAFLLETVNSDIPFIFITLVSIIYYLKYTKYHELRYLLYAIIFGLFSYFVRDAGAAICGSFAILGLVKLFRDQNFHKAFLYLIPVLVIVLFKLFVPSFNSNLMSDLSSKLSLDRCIQPLFVMYECVAKNILPLNRFYDNQLLLLIIWLCVISGFYKLVKITKTEFSLFLIFFIIGYLSIHVYSGAIEERYFLIIQIIATISFILALIDFLYKFKLNKEIVSLVLLIVSIEAAAKDLVRIKNWCFTENYTFGNEVETNEAKAAWCFINENTKEKDIVFFRKPTVLRLFTRRNSCVFMEDSIFLNRPNLDFYELNASTCGTVKNHLVNVKVTKDTVFSNSHFTICKVIRIKPSPLNPKP
jgi:hypothetical protein